MTGMVIEERMEVVMVVVTGVVMVVVTGMVMEVVTELVIEVVKRSIEDVMTARELSCDSLWQDKLHSSRVSLALSPSLSLAHLLFHCLYLSLSCPSLCLNGWYSSLLFYSFTSSTALPALAVCHTSALGG